MWETRPGTGFKPQYCSFNHSKSSWNAKGVSTLGTTSFDVQVQHLLTVATNLLSCFETEENNFVSRIIAFDETLVRSFKPEMKRQATEWHMPNSPRPSKGN